MTKLMQRALTGTSVALIAAMLTLTAGTAEGQKGTDKGKTTETKGKTTDTGKAGPLVIELYKAKDGDFRFRIKDADDNILAIAQKSYEKKEDIMRVIDLIRKGGASAKLDDQTTKK